MPTDLQIQTTRLADAKEDMRLAINEKGVACDSSVLMADYPDKIADINGTNYVPSDPVTVVFNWIGQDHEPRTERVTVNRGESVTPPPTFGDNIAAIGEYPALDRYGTVGLLSGETLANVDRDLVVATYYRLPATSSVTRVTVVVDNRNGILEGTLNIATQNMSTAPLDVDWGDGSPISTAAPFTHTYAVGGIYYIKASATVSPSQAVVTSPIWSNNSYPEKVGAQVKRVYLFGDRVDLGTNPFMYCVNLEVVALARWVISFSYSGDLLSAKYMQPYVLNTMPGMVITSDGSVSGDSSSTYGPKAQDSTIAGYTWPRVEIAGASRMLGGTSTVADYFSGQTTLLHMPDIAKYFTSANITIRENFLRNTGIIKTRPLPSGVTTIHPGLMNDCNELIDASNLFENITNAMLYGNNTLMNGCASMETISDLPTVGIGGSMCFFNDCKSLKHIPTLRHDLGQIVAENFANRCYSLESFGTESDGSFGPAGTVRIGGEFMNNCFKLKHFYKTTGSTFTTNISGSAGRFMNCYCLETVDLRGCTAANAPHITNNEDGTGGTICFGNCYSLRKIYVDNSELANYQQLQYGWSKYYGILEGR